MKYFDNFQESIDEPCFDHLTVEDLSEPQAIQLKFRNWAAAMIANPPMYQGKPVNPDGAIANYFGLVKTRFMEDDRFKHHQDLQGEVSWFTAYKMELVKATRDKINKCVIDVDIDNSENNQVAIIRKKPSTVDINDEDIPDLVTLMGELAASSITNNYELRALINTTFQAD